MSARKTAGVIAADALSVEGWRRGIVQIERPDV
jgi:hypothetical protein